MIFFENSKMHFEMHFPTPRKNEFFSKSKMLQRYYLFLNITKKKEGIFIHLFLFIFLFAFFENLSVPNITIFSTLIYYDFKNVTI